MKFLTLSALLLSLSSFANTPVPKRGEVPTTDDTAYIERQHNEVKRATSGSDKRRQKGSQEVIDTEIEMEEHMPHGERPMKKK